MLYYGDTIPDLQSLWYNIFLIRPSNKKGLVPVAISFFAPNKVVTSIAFYKFIESFKIPNNLTDLYRKIENYLKIGFEKEIQLKN